MVVPILLVIFAGIYFPVTHTQLAPLHDKHERIEAQETGLPHERAGIAAPLASVDAMVAEAQRRWAAKGRVRPCWKRSSTAPDAWNSGSVSAPCVPISPLTAHSASRRESPKQSKAPAVA